MSPLILDLPLIWAYNNINGTCICNGCADCQNALNECQHVVMDANVNSCSLQMKKNSQILDCANHSFNSYTDYVITGSNLNNISIRNCVFNRTGGIKLTRTYNIHIINITSYNQPKALLYWQNDQTNGNSTIENITVYGFRGTKNDGHDGNCMWISTDHPLYMRNIHMELDLNIATRYGIEFDQGEGPHYVDNITIIGGGFASLAVSSSHNVYINHSSFLKGGHANDNSWNYGGGLRLYNAIMSNSIVAEVRDPDAHAIRTGNCKFYNVTIENSTNAMYLEGDTEAQGLTIRNVGEGIFVDSSRTVNISHLYIQNFSQFAIRGSPRLILKHANITSNHSQYPAIYLTNINYLIMENTTACHIKKPDGTDQFGFSISLQSGGGGPKAPSAINGENNYGYYPDTMDSSVKSIIEPMYVLSPPNGSEKIPPVNFSAAPCWNATSCEVIINSISYPLEKHGNIFWSEISPPVGTHDWQIKCDNLYSFTRTITILGGRVNLLEPAPQSVLPYNEINVSYHYWSSQLNTSWCALYVDNRLYDNRTVANNSIVNLSINLSDGQHTERIICKDARNTSVFWTDTQPPIVTTYTPDNVVFHSSINFSFNVNDTSPNVSCMLSLINHTNQTGHFQPGNHSFSQTLPNGTYYWAITCTDAANHTNTTPIRRLEVDLLPPTITVHRPQNNSLIPDDHIWLSLHVEDDHLNGTTIKTIHNGTIITEITFNTSEFSYNLTSLPESGVYIINITARDNGGHENHTYLNITWDNSSIHLSLDITTHKNGLVLAVCRYNSTYPIINLTMEATGPSADVHYYIMPNNTEGNISKILPTMKEVRCTAINRWGKEARVEKSLYIPSSSRRRKKLQIIIGKETDGVWINITYRGKPIEASIMVDGPNRFVISNYTSSWFLKNLPSGIFYVEVRKPGYKTVVETFKYEQPPAQPEAPPEKEEKPPVKNDETETVQTLPGIRIVINGNVGPGSNFTITAQYDNGTIIKNVTMYLNGNPTVPHIEVPAMPPEEPIVKTVNQTIVKYQKINTPVPWYMWVMPFGLGALAGAGLVWWLRNGPGGI